MVRRSCPVRALKFDGHADGTDQLRHDDGRMRGRAWQVVRVKNYMALDHNPAATAGLRVRRARAWG
jgi:hypothetical protein